MNNASKGSSPFCPGQPVSQDFFIGRSKEIERIIRDIKQVEHGKMKAVFVSGEYGIGKSSFAGFLRYYAEKNNNLLGVHVLLGGAKTLEDVAIKTVQAVLHQQTYSENRSEKICNFLADYIGNQSLFGLNINFEALKTDAPNISSGYLPFLQELLSRSEGAKGIMLILDEINGIADNPDFAHFIKCLVDENALSRKPLPILLMLCGVEDRRSQMIRNHPSVARIFDVVEIEPMNAKEMIEFFTKTFSSVNMQVTDEAMRILCSYSGGLPRFMHIIGDNTFWSSEDTLVDGKDAIKGLAGAADEIGRKFVEPQVYKALHSNIYRTILAKLAKEDFVLSFKKSAIEKGLSAAEKKTFHNFLQRMKELGVLRSGEGKGEYVFNSLLVQLYIQLKSKSNEK